MKNNVNYDKYRELKRFYTCCAQRKTGSVTLQTLIVSDCDRSHYIEIFGQRLPIEVIQPCNALLQIMRGGKNRQPNIESVQRNITSIFLL